MKKITYALAFLSLGVFSYLLVNRGANGERQNKELHLVVPTPAKTKKKTIEEKYEHTQDRVEYEFNLQKDPVSGEVPKIERALELNIGLEKLSTTNITQASENSYTLRGPSNLGGRTRSIIIDISDSTGNTMLAGGVSSGVFRTTNGGESWTKVTPNNEIHNVVSIAQDPRPGFQNIMYYSTGEPLGNSASLGAGFLGQGIWQSVDGGVTWTQIPGTDSTFEAFDSPFDLTFSLAVSPITGDLFVATINSIMRYDGATFTTELNAGGNNFTDVDIDTTGRVYAAIGGTGVNNGVYTSETGDGTWIRIAENGDPTGWSSVGRVVVATAPSDTNVLYVIYGNGASSAANQVESDIWRYDLAADEWTDFTSKMPNLPGGPIGGVDPFSIQGGYDLDIVVRPDDANYVAIAGTSAYRIENIETDNSFEIIGGYNGAMIALYDTPNGDTHHPDVHSLVFSPFDTNVFFTGSDGGVHRTDDINAPTVDWVNLNNNYQTYQYYDVFLDQLEGSDFVIGGAQDNGTTGGGVSVGLPNETEMLTIFGGDGVSVGIGRTEGNLIGYFGSQLGLILRQNFTTGNLVNIQPTNTNNSLFVTLFHLDPDNNNALYYANGGQLFGTTNASTVNSSTWNNLGFLPTNELLRSFATTRGTYDPATSYLLIGGQNGGVFRLDDPQNASSLGNAINITPPAASTVQGSIVSAMAIHPTNPDIAMVVYANYNIPSIFITSNATSDTPDWTLVEGNIAPNSMRSAQILEVEGQIQYFVGTARGLYSNIDPENIDWELEGGSILGIPVVSDLEYRPSDNTLLIGTHGNGMFATELTTVLAVDDFAENDADENILRVFPNPTSDILNFRTSGANNIREYQIIDYTGRILEGGDVANLSQGTIDVSGYTNGVYFIRAITQNNATVTTRFIKR
ncbi:T9SS type A sorting domain-containing protein [uncultured Dokdonia sp.]|uniref:T9SS type A sorting domain-containing protein n=1 Tax=uncultured Dokdonia sp. TaxID=575653 RepID=UPI00262FD94C|nr:T9SS type A sorting domain-containing protein [uncultured Dokdonia sp.]